MVTATTFWTVAAAVAFALLTVSTAVYFNRRRINTMTQRLFGSNLGDDTGVLARLDSRLQTVDSDLDDIRSQMREQTRLDTERTNQVERIIEQLDEIDGVNVQRQRDGSYLVHDDEDFLRGSQAEAETPED